MNKKEFINWDRTKQQFGFTIDDNLTPSDQVIINCRICGAEKTITFGSIRKRKNKPFDAICKSCHTKEMWSNNPQFRRKQQKTQSAAMKKVWKTKEYYENQVETHKIISKKKWQDPEYAKKVRKGLKQVWKDNPDRFYHGPQSEETKQRKRKAMLQRYKENPELRKRLSQSSKANWKDPKYRSKMMDLYASPEYKAKQRELWKNPEYKKKASTKAKKLWEDPEYREKAAIARANQPRVSSIQEILYSILDDLEVKYYREYNDKSDDPECIIGPWGFDCVIPREGSPDLLIECQGDYWHSLDKAKRNDQSKASYIANNFPDQYELKTLWEHEFLNHNKVIELIKYWLGITELEIRDFDFSNVQIKKCPALDYKSLLGKYHYLPNAGRGGQAYGAYLDNELIAVCIFSPLVRQNIRLPKGVKQNEARELSRLCIHPRYQKKNFASWLVSRCIKKLPKKYKFIISYCDTTFNHDGAVYKACNFVQDKTVPADYWYVSKEGWTMHKRTLYGHAQKMSMAEKEYADTNNYRKIFGKEKLRFVYRR